MTVLFLLLACEPKGDIPLDTDTSPVDNDGCGDTIYVPQSGVDTTDPVAADLDAATFGGAPDPSAVHLSWVGDPSESMAFVWLTDNITLASQVEFGLADTYGTVTPGASFELLNGETFGRVHEVHVCGLTPATTYHYRVGGEGHWSADHTFTTGPAPGSTTAYRFVVAGDSRNNAAVWGQILEAAEQFAPDFYIFSGDAVELGSDLEEWRAWLGEGLGYIERRPMVMIHGNHEFMAQPFFGLFAMPANASADRTDDEQWFSFDYGNGHFVVLNDTLAPLDTQATWMTGDLAATSQPWKFVSHHQPAYSSSTTHGSNIDVREAWSPVEEAAGVALDLVGHNHNYERSVPLRDGVETDLASGTTYVVSGGAGADLYGNDLAEPFTATATVDNNWVLVEVNGGTLTLNAYDLSGNVIDTLTLSRSAP